jgi:hypothetical protein
VSVSLTQSDINRGGPQLAVITELLVQCLADPGCRGSDQVLAEILYRRREASAPALADGCPVPPCHPGGDLRAAPAGEDRLVLCCAICEVPLLVVTPWRPPDVEAQPVLAAAAEAGR